jgi:hypothetical protein
MRTLYGAADLEQVEAMRPNQHTFVTRVELAGLSGEGSSTCGKYIDKFATELASEASRVEESNRPPDVEGPEITAATISIAYRGIMQRQVIAAAYETQERRKNWKDRGMQIFATLSVAAASVFGSYLHAKWQVGVFAVLAVLAVLSTFYVIWGQK